MKIIRKLSDMIEDELEGACEYVRKALELKDEDRSLADTLYQLSQEEMGHMKILHEQVVRKIEEYRKAKGEPPSTMMAVYEYLHGKHIDKANSIEVYQKMYAER